MSEDPFDCKHEQQKLRKRKQANGVLVVCRQCLRCGRNGGCVPKQNINLSTLEPWDDSLADEWSARRQNWWRQQLEQRRQAESDAFWQRWQEHMVSAKWKVIRQKVLSRCKGICEGCGQQAAVQVHHLTYKHLGDEFLFELVALCLECHERVHDDNASQE